MMVELGVDIVEYSVHDWSSYSGEFSPHHILEDKPFDQKSRWLSDGSHSPQYSVDPKFIVLKLTNPAVVHAIKFGKYERHHQCNIRRLKIYGGMELDQLHLLHDGGLENSSEPETLLIQHCLEGQPLPCTYIKIVPLQSWGNGFNFSIWYVELTGQTSESVVAKAMASYTAYREREALRLCLKHLRQNDYTEAFEALQKKARVELEHPLLTKLHRLLVVNGDFKAAEDIVKESIENGYLDDYLDSQSLESTWSELKPCGDGSEWPSMRGAHQLCFESCSQLIYLHGGWDGTKELGDLWTYSVAKGLWQCVYRDTSLAGGPTPRSCHRMCIDESTRTLYFLGRYVEISPHDITEPLSDFYCYQVDSCEWKLLSSDTASSGGPRLVFDHQMCFVATTQSLYVFGGRVLSPNRTGDVTYSGLYVYQTLQKEWTCLQPDYRPSQKYTHSLLPRMDHAMFFEKRHHLLYVLGGEKNNEALGDMLTYDILSHETSTLADGHETQVPEHDLTIQTCFNQEKQEIILIANLSRFQDSHGLPQVKSTSPVPTWLYNVHTHKWLSVKQSGTGPCPRFAHQVIYDNINKTCYMFGGHPGDLGKVHHSPMRLDDLWSMKIVRQDRRSLLRHCQLLVREQRFIELASNDPTHAVSYLQNDVSDVIDHKDAVEREKFQNMTTQLFSTSNDHPGESVSLQRNKVYCKICDLFPNSMTQPSQNISDMINLVPQ